MHGALDFEKPLIAAETMLEEVFAEAGGRFVSLEEVAKLRRKIRRLRHDIFTKLSPWQRTQIARHAARPCFLDLAKLMFEDAIEIHGDRTFADDQSIVTMLARFEGRSVVAIGHQKGRNVKENILRNFGMPHPEGYRKALRAMMLAEKFGKPVLTFIDTPGADAAHYMMSVTKSLTSAIAGAALDRGLIASEDQPIGELLPKELFGSPENLEDKGRITVRQALNMSALDVPHIVSNTDPAARKNYSGWFGAENRVRYALAQRKVQRPMGVMNYTDLTCSLVNGIVHYQSRQTAFEFANQHLFSRMGFRNHEWMSQDRTGIELGGFGIRLRPLDMAGLGAWLATRGTADPVHRAVPYLGRACLASGIRHRHQRPDHAFPRRAKADLPDGSAALRDARRLRWTSRPARAASSRAPRCPSSRSGRLTIDGSVSSRPRSSARSRRRAVPCRRSPTRTTAAAARGTSSETSSSRLTSRGRS